MNQTREHQPAAPDRKPERRSPAQGVAILPLLTPVLTRSNVRALQRSIGNAAVGEFVRARAPVNKAATVSQRQTVGVIQRDTREGYPEVPKKTKPHRDNWRDFVNTQYGLVKQKLLTKFSASQIDTTLQKPYEEALAFAKELDSRSSQGGPSVDPLTVDVSTGQLTAPKELQDKLNAMWAVVRKEVTIDVPDVIVPVWGPMVTGGMGSWVRAMYTRNSTLAQGSSASGTTTELPWLDDMLTHRGYDLSKNNTIYVRGHLLNDHLGGPSTPYNLVPLTGEPTASSANANKSHEGSVESLAKEALTRLFFNRDNPDRSPSPSDVTDVEYSVAAKWMGQTRPGTGQVAAGAQAFEALLTDILTNNPKANMAKLTVEDARKWIAPQNYDALWTKNIKDPMDAIVEVSKRNVVLATDALAVMKKNAELWAYEDRVVPGNLQCSVKIYYLNGTKDQFQQVVDNSLPSQPQTPYVKTTLPTISPSKPQAFGQAREGYADVPAKTKAHSSNWREFVNAQYGLMNQKLLGKFTAPQIDVALGKNYQEALALANQLDEKSSRKAPTLDPLTVNVAAARLDAPKALQDKLNTMWNEVRKEVTLDVPDVLVPEWGAMVTGGMGSWVTATYTRNSTLAAGSAASGTKTAMPWMDDMLTHRGYELSKNNTIYVRGHLLNDHLGGPSVPYNLVPLTGEPTASSANANKTHEGSVESMAKEAVTRLYFHRDNPQLSPSGNDITKVDYRVEAKWPGPTRAATAKVAAAAQAFETLLADIKTNRPKTNMARLTVEEARQSIASNKYDRLWTNLIKDAMDAVVEINDRDTVKAKDALAVMKKNAELWAYEDRVVPGSLQCSVKIHFLNGGTEQFNQVVDNGLPTRAYAPYVKQ